VPAPIARKSLSIWIASSRVGAMINARGSAALRSVIAGWVSRRWITATRNAAVLPVPVWPAGDIAAGQRQRQGQRLDRRAARESRGVQPASKSGCNSKLSKKTSVSGCEWSGI